MQKIYFLPVQIHIPPMTMQKDIYNYQQELMHIYTPSFPVQSDSGTLYYVSGTIS